MIRLVIEDYLPIKAISDEASGEKSVRKLVGCSRRTAARDLDDMLDKGIIQRQGAGRSAYYVWSRNRAINLPNVPSTTPPASPENGVANRAIIVPNVPSQEMTSPKRTGGESKRTKKRTNRT